MKSRDLAMFGIGFIAAFASLAAYPMARAKIKPGEVHRASYRLDPDDPERNQRRYDDIATNCDRNLKSKRCPLWVTLSLNTQPRAD